MVQRDRPQMTVWCMRSACGYLRLQTHTHNMQYLMFSTAIQVALPDGLDTNFTLVHGYQYFSRSSVRLSHTSCCHSTHSTKSQQPELAFNVDSGKARSPVPWQDNRTNCAKIVSKYGPVKTTDEQSPPMDKIVGSICLLSSLPSFQTPTIKLLWCILLDYPTEVFPRGVKAKIVYGSAC